VATTLSLAVALQRLAEDALRLAVRVHVGGVEEVHPEFERALDDRFPLLLVEDPLAPIRVAEAHTAETDLRDRRPGASERRVLHMASRQGK